MKTLMDYSREGNLRKIQYMVKQGADIHASNDFLLRWAAKNGYLKIVKYIVKYSVVQGDDINVLDEALHWAAENGQLEIVKYLVEQDADIHSWNDYALRWAFKNGHHEVAEFLRKVDK